MANQKTSDYTAESNPTGKLLLDAANVGDKNYKLNLGDNPTDTFTTTSKTIMGAINELNAKINHIYYVTDPGSDTNDGKNDSHGLATLQKGIDLAYALTPSVSNIFVIRVIGALILNTTNLDLKSPYIYIDAPDATIIENNTIATYENTVIRANRIVVNNHIDRAVGSGTGNSYVIANEIACAVGYTYQVLAGTVFSQVEYVDSSTANTFAFVSGGGAGDTGKFYHIGKQVLGDVYVGNVGTRAVIKLTGELTGDLECQAAGSGLIVTDVQNTFNGNATAPTGTAIYMKHRSRAGSNSGNVYERTFFNLPGNTIVTGNFTVNGTSLLKGNVTIGDNTATNFTLTFDGLTNDGVITFNQTDAIFEFNHDVQAGNIRITDGNPSLFFNDTNDDKYALETHNDHIHFHNLINNSDALFCFFPKAGDRGDICAIRIYGFGSVLAENNIEYLSMGWNVTNAQYQIETGKLGTGQNQKISIFTNANTDQLLLNTDGTINTLSNVTIGNGAVATDYTLTFDGNTQDGVITYVDSTDTFDFSCSFSLNSGQAINEISTDTTMGGDSNTAVITEHVAKTYIDNAVSGENLWDRVTGTPNYLIPHTAADQIGATGARITKGWFSDINSSTITITGTSQFDGNITVGNASATPSITFDGASQDGVITYIDATDTFDLSCSFSLNSGQAVNEISTDTTMTDDSDTALVTEHAAKTYIDGAVSSAGYWQRVGTLISPATAGDDVRVDNNLTIGVGAVGTDYSITFDGNLGNGVIKWDNADVKIDFTPGINVNGSLTLTSAYPRILFSDTNSQLYTLDTYSTDQFHLTGQQGNTDAMFHFYSYDSDRTENVQIKIFGFGVKNASDTEYLMIGWNTSTAQFELTTQKTGSANSQKLSLATAGNIDQLLLNTDGSINTSGNLTIGNGSADTDFTLTFHGETSDGVITWMEDEAAFRLGTGTEYFEIDQGATETDLLSTNTTINLQTKTTDGSTRLNVISNGAGQSYLGGEYGSDSNASWEIIQGTSSAAMNFGSSTTKFTINSAGADKDIVIEGDTNQYLFITDAGNDRVGINASAPSGKLAVNQNTTDAGIPALWLQQLDTSEGFIDFIGTMTGSLSTSTINSAGSIPHEVNGVVKYIPYYDSVA